MSGKIPRIRLILLLVMLLPHPGQAADLEREQRLADQIVDAILDGEPLTLKAGTLEFLGIYTPAEAATPHGAVIILHGRGMHPDWAQVAGPLRIALPVHGWSTLSLQMPVLAKDARYYDYVPVFPEAIPRIEAGITYLQSRGYARIVLLAHSCGVHMSMAWLEVADKPQIAGYIGIGMGATDYGQPMRKPFPFDRLKVPFLSILGSEDYPAVQRMAADIKSRMHDFAPLSAQRTIPGADHYYDDYQDALTDTVADWLESLVAGPGPAEPVSPQ
jgi:alpha-beta hydrolase superfamily lysophospholipase